MRTTADHRRPVLTQPIRQAGIPSIRDVLQWMYVGRTTVAIVVFLAAAFSFDAVDPVTLVILAVAALASVISSGISFWWSHLRAVGVGMTFLYAQALFDLGLVTTVVHVTEGPDSQFPALYILVIAVSAVLMPFASSLLITRWPVCCTSPTSCGGTRCSCRSRSGCRSPSSWSSSRRRASLPAVSA